MKYIVLFLIATMFLVGCSKESKTGDAKLSTTTIEKKHMQFTNTYGLKYRQPIVMDSLKNLPARVVGITWAGSNPKDSIVYYAITFETP